MDFNLAAVHEAISERIPDRECILWRDRRLTYADVTDRSRRLGSVLRDAGLGLHTERSALDPWQSGQDHVALYLHNCNEYLEAMLGAYKARTVPVNVNYRYVESELVYLFADARPRAIVYHSAFAPTLARVLPELDGVEVLLQVADESAHPLLPGAVDYEAALAAALPTPPPGPLDPDDLYIVYTGGTTGMPKAVLWRQADIFAAVLAAQRDADGLASLDAVLSSIENAPRYLPASPFMHGSGQWFAFVAFHYGGTVVLPDDTTRFDVRDLWATIQREGVQGLSIVGDPFARPMLAELETGAHDPSTLRLIASGGAPLTDEVKRRLLERLPGILLVDTLGSSETGAQGQTISMGSVPVRDQLTFPMTPDTRVVDDDRVRFLPECDDSIGWLAKLGPIPLGYLGDEAKTRATFPVIDGIRCSVPGDRVRHLPGGVLGFAGRESITINSGGEKIFAEEVEAALKHNPDVYDVVVVGRPSERWGQEVVAIVQLAVGARLDEDALREECAVHLARYKLPKAFIVVDLVLRSPAGKADYRWAKEQAVAAAGAVG
jgi:3-oxocholest-4-en-26-oate---CoA ligase